jgi:hypothetical protein
MISIARQASALFLALCFSGYSNAQDVTSQTHDISDDGFANVPLQFGFPFYGQTFNNSWMFSNGIISFQDPNQSGLAWSNLSVQNFSTNMGSQFNYSIFPLWTDLINIVGSFTSQGNAEFQRYNWIGISPFYDSSRLNTFSVEIRPDGTIVANYSLINVDYAIVGTVGDASRGEFDQIYDSPASITDWQRYTSSTISPEPSTPPAVITVTPMVEIMESNTGVEVSLVTSTPTTDTEITATESAPTRSSVSGISVARILNIISREQARISALENSAVIESMQQSLNQVDPILQDTESLVIKNATESQFSGAASQHSGENINASISTNVTATSGISRADPNAMGHDTDTTTGSGSTDAVSVTGFSAVDTLRSEPRVVVDDTAREQKSPDTRASTSDNELAGGVTLVSLGAAPMGFQAYQVMMPDAAFYAPRDIYRGQQTVDNARALRGLGSDQLHQDMIDQQYRR